MRVEKWNGFNIRFIESDGEWWAVLKDICDALELKTFKVAQRLESNMMKKVIVDTSTSDIPLRYSTSKARKTQEMLVVNETGIYEALFASRRPEARKFRIWTASVLNKLRVFVGLEGYEALRLTDKDIQDKIDSILDCLYWDEERKELMISVTVQGGDVDQIPFEEYVKN